MDFKTFLDKARSEHGDKYHYFEESYKEHSVKINCPKHGIFKQSPAEHLLIGCPYCNKEKLKNAKKQSRAARHSSEKHLRRRSLSGNFIRFLKRKKDKEIDFDESESEVSSFTESEFSEESSETSVGQGTPFVEIVESNKTDEEKFKDLKEPVNLDTDEESVQSEQSEQSKPKKRRKSIIGKIRPGKKKLKEVRTEKEVPIISDDEPEKKDDFEVDEKEVQMTMEEFIKCSKLVYGERHKNVKFTNGHLLINCSRHGAFKRDPNKYLYQYHDCKRCVEPNKVKKAEFVYEMINKFGFEYDLSQVRYINENSPVTVIKNNKMIKMAPKKLLNV